MEKSWTLVTGGAKGLGAAICLALAEKGLPILVHFRNSEQDAKNVTAACRAFGISAESIQGDFSSPDNVTAFILRCRERYPSIGNLVNNAGSYLVKSAAETSMEEWNDIFQTNLHAPFALSRAFLPALRETRGSIVNIGVAGAGRLAADTYSTAYLAAKTGLWMLTKSLAKELAPEQVRVNMVSPGYMENTIDLPSNAKALPMGRPAALGEVARVVAFLADEQSSYITGQNIEISGAVRL